MPAPNQQQVEPASLENWGDFKLFMLADEAYQRVSQLSDKLMVSRVELFFSIEGEALGAVIKLWWMMMQAVPEAQWPNSSEVARWKAIARATHMPITFDEKGLLEVVGDDD